jgi:hypothetical protein
LELSIKDFKAIIVQILQKAITNPNLNGKIKISANKRRYRDPIKKIRAGKSNKLNLKSLLIDSVTMRK